VAEEELGYNPMENIKKYLSKKGQVLNMVTMIVIGIMVLIFTIFAVLFGIAKLNPSALLTGAESTAMAHLQSNLTSGVSQFAQYIPIILIVLGVVMAISGIVILIVYVRRMSGGTGL